MQTCLCHRQGKRTWLDRDSNPGSLNLNSLLVNRQIDNPTPGAVTGGKDQGWFLFVNAYGF